MYIKRDREKGASLYSVVYIQRDRDRICSIIMLCTMLAVISARRLGLQGNASNICFQHGTFVIELRGTLLRSGVLFQVEALVLLTVHWRRSQKFEEASTMCPASFDSNR